MLYLQSYYSQNAENSQEYSVHCFHPVNLSEFMNLEVVYSSHIT